MGDIITMGESVMITIFSMVVVFIVLIAISYLIEILRVTTNGKKKAKKNLKKSNCRRKSS